MLYGNDNIRQGRKKGRGGEGEEERGRVLTLSSWEVSGRSSGSMVVHWVMKSLSSSDMPPGFLKSGLPFLAIKNSAFNMDSSR